MDKVHFGRSDQSVEPTGTSFDIDSLTAGNFATQVAAFGDLQDALDAMSLSAAHKTQISHVITQTAKSNAGNRELKWLITVQDTVNAKQFSHELGCADDSLTVLNVGGKTILDPTSAEWIALGTAISGFVKSSYGNNVTLVEVELVGRNL